MTVRDEDGQVLILALGFLVFFGLVIGTLLNFASTSILSTERLREQRATVYAADGATDAAIQVGRVNPAVGAYGGALCQPATSQPLLTTTATTTDHTAASVVCTSTADPLQADRTVSYTTSVNGVQIVAAQVIYHDGVAAGGTPTVNVISWTYCAHDAGTC
jgi:hypothetical protein